MTNIGFDQALATVRRALAYIVPLPLPADWEEAFQDPRTRLEFQLDRVVDVRNLNPRIRGRGPHAGRRYVESPADIKREALHLYDQGRLTVPACRERGFLPSGSMAFRAELPDEGLHRWARQLDDLPPEVHQLAQTGVGKRMLDTRHHRDIGLTCDFTGVADDALLSLSWYATRPLTCGEREYALSVYLYTLLIQSARELLQSHYADSLQMPLNGPEHKAHAQMDWLEPLLSMGLMLPDTRLPHRPDLGVSFQAVPVLFTPREYQ